MADAIAYGDAESPDVVAKLAPRKKWRQRTTASEYYSRVKNFTTASTAPCLAWL
jgi:hypothetical protein